MGHGNQLASCVHSTIIKTVKILSEGSGYNSAKFCSENFPLYGRRPGCRVSKLNVVVQGDSSFLAE